MADGLHVFLVDDDEAQARALAAALEQHGCKVTTCRTAADTVTILPQKSADLLLVAKQLPDSTGLELAAQLAREGITCPTVLLTELPDAESFRQALHAGVQDVLPRQGAIAQPEDAVARLRGAIQRLEQGQLASLFARAIESSQDGVMVTDLHGHILHANRAMERITGYSRAELLGQTPRIFRNERTPAIVFVELWNTILARRSWEGELCNKRKDGSFVDVLLTISPILDSTGQLTHFVAIQRDVSRQKMLEKQLLQAQKTQSLGTLAGGIAHEFNNLLTGVNGYASLALQNPALPEELQEYMNRIMELSDRAAALTRQLLSYARKPLMSPKMLRIKDLLQDTADFITNTQHIGVTVDLPSPEEASMLWVQGDVNRLQQALVNLALNARDSQGGMGPILLRVRSLVLAEAKVAFPENVPAGDYVWLEVRDQGTGMSPDVLAKALDPFFTTKGVGKGTGLGLPMVQGVVRAHQGYLTLDSQLGKGTSVGIYLPRLAEPPRKKKKKPPPPIGHVIEPEAAPGRQVLLVEDEDALRDVVQRFLETAGQHVHWAKSSVQAIEHLATHELDVLVLDPIRSADDTARLVIAWHQRFPGKPILFCANQTMSLEIRHVLEETPHRFLRKPFRMTELWHALQAILPSSGGVG